MFVGRLFRQLLPEFQPAKGDKVRVLDLCAAPGGKTTDLASSCRLAFGDAFLGGQNYVSVLLANAQNINRAKSTMYDQTCTEQIQNAMHDYFNGIVDLDTAWNNFYTVMLEKHPELSF